MLVTIPQGYLAGPGPAPSCRRLTSAVLEHSLHGALAIGGPANAGGTGDLVLDGPPALPEVHLMVIVHKEKRCEGKDRPDPQKPFQARPPQLSGASLQAASAGGDPLSSYFHGEGKKGLSAEVALMVQAAFLPSPPLSSRSFSLGSSTTDLPTGLWESRAC